jgi:hypothetical protein
MVDDVDVVVVVVVVGSMTVVGSVEDLRTMGGKMTCCCYNKIPLKFGRRCPFVDG